MQGLGKYLSEKQECNDVNSIQDINFQYSYEDKFGRGLFDRGLVSCGQYGSSSGYNELERFYDTYLASHFKGLVSNKQAIKTLCECCKELPSELRTDNAFKKCVGEKLNLKII